MHKLPLFTMVTNFPSGDSLLDDKEPKEGQQLTFSGFNHELDNNENFTSDGGYICYDTRETWGKGIEHSTTIEVLELASGREIIVYEPDEISVGSQPAPGVAAVSFNPAGNDLAFIHGPLVFDVPKRGAYGWSNRTGARITMTGNQVMQNDRWRMVTSDGAYNLSWIDFRDVTNHTDTKPGAHRGGTHRHEYSMNGMRIGFTYDDFLLPEYGRTVGYMEAHIFAPKPASHYFAVIVPVVPKGTSKVGEIEKAYADSWVDQAGTMRAFIGVVRNEDGNTFQESLFVADIPADVDITSAYSGNHKQYPVPPKGITIRRLTHDWAGGIVRGAPDGSRIAYFGKDINEVTQVYIIPCDGSDKHPDPSKHPVQATFLAKGTKSGLRWFPDSLHILCMSDNGLVKTCVEPGTNFGRSTFVTPHGDSIERYAPAISPDGKKIVYNCLIPTFDENRNLLKNYSGKDFSQIFLTEIS